MNSDQPQLIAQQKQPRVISWSKLIPLLLSQLDNDRRIKLNTLYTRFTRMEIEKVAFFQLTRSIVGDDRIMKMAIDKLNTPLVPSPPHVQAQAGASVPLVPPMTSNEKPANEPCIGRKKPLEALGQSSEPQSSNKKRKVSAEGGLSDIEQLNDVTAVSGVDLREEEEKMFSGPKVGSRVSEASRKVAQEEEERLILEKGPLQKKLAEIMTKCGLESASQDVIRCLSMCAEERLKGVISNAIRVSKQKADHEEKSRHRIVITSDVRQQIRNLNRKTGEDLERKEADKIQMVEETNKEDEISKLRRTAANVAARAAVGGADMLSKWQLMAQARQECEGHIGVASVSQPSKDVNLRLISATRSVMQDNEGGEKGSGAAKSNRDFGRSKVSVAQTRVARSVSAKDVIAVLEREPQMAKSTLMYRLYERVPLSDTSGEQSLKCI